MSKLNFLCWLCYQICCFLDKFTLPPAVTGVTNITSAQMHPPSSRWHFMYWNSPKSLPQETTALREAKQNIKDRREVLDKCCHFLNGYFHPIPCFFVSPKMGTGTPWPNCFSPFLYAYIFKINSLFFWPLQMIICICRLSLFDVFHLTFLSFVVVFHLSLFIFVVVCRCLSFDVVCCLSFLSLFSVCPFLWK